VVEGLQKFFGALNKDEHTYLASLSKSMSRSLEEFYCNINNCGISAISGDGFNNFEVCVENAVEEYYKDYCSFLQSQKVLMEARREKVIQERLAQFERDLDKSKTAISSNADSIKRSEEDCEEDCSTTTTTTTTTSTETRSFRSQRKLAASNAASNTSKLNAISEETGINGAEESIASVSDLFKKQVILEDDRCEDLVLPDAEEN